MKYLDHPNIGKQALFCVFVILAVGVTCDMKVRGYYVCTVCEND